MTKKTQFKNSLHREIFKLCDSAKLKPHNFVRGSKLFNNYQRVCLLVLYIQSGKSLRYFLMDLDGSLSSWKSWLRLRKLPKRSTLHDWLKSFKLGFIRKILHLTTSELTPEITAIDGSGIDAYHQSSYYQKRLKDFGFLKKKSSWHKLDIIVDVKSDEKLILDFSFLLHPRGDSRVAKQLFKRLKFENSFILGDKGYYCFDLFRSAKYKRNILVVPPKKYGSSKFKHSNFIRTEFKETYLENEEKYRLRNNVESVFSSLKRVQGVKLRSKKAHFKKKEIAWQIVWHNLRKKLSCPKFLDEFWLIFYYNYKFIMWKANESSQKTRKLQKYFILN